MKFFDQEKRQQRLVLPLGKTAVQMSDSVLLTRARAGHAGADDPQPKASASLNDENRFARPLLLGLQQRQAAIETATSSPRGFDRSLASTGFTCTTGRKAASWDSVTRIIPSSHATSTKRSSIEASKDGSGKAKRLPPFLNAFFLSCF
jgi:hypothetical protein